MSVASTKFDAWRQIARWKEFGLEDPATFTRGERLRYALASAAGRTILAVLARTMSSTSSGDDELRPQFDAGGPGAIFVAWHNRLPGVLTYFDLCVRRSSKFRFDSLISASRDGEYVARVARDSNSGVIRGSSSRDAVASLKHAIARVRAGSNVFNVADGPRGPRYVLKPGAILLSRLTGAPIYPFSWACTRVAQMHRAWDQMMFPLPFSRIEYRFGPPLHVPQDADDAAMAAARREMETRLMALTDWADAATGVALQIPRPKPGEILKRRKGQAIDPRRV